MNDKFCFRYNKEIEEMSQHHIFIHMNEGKEDSRSFVHATCWDEFINLKGVVQNAQGMLTGLQKHLTDQGILKPEKKEFLIK